MTAFDGWTPAMLKSRIRAISTIDGNYIDHLRREISQLEAERHELYQLLLLGGDTIIMGKPAHIDVTITWQDGPPHGFTLQEIAGAAP
jgi:hypothetical protein